jgi:hypothetical protein
MGETTEPGRVRRVSVAVTHGDPPSVVMAADEAVLTRAVALEIVAKTSPASLRPGYLDGIRDALLAEEWSDAILLWMDATGDVVDAYPDEPVWTEAHLDGERTVLELRVAPIFRD